jgi:predicted dehydrogenase
VLTDAGRLRLAVVGCGRVFERFHLPALLRVPEFEVVTLVDPDPERLAQARERLPGAVPARSLDEVVEIPADAALVLTPPRAHVELTQRLLLSGQHVLVEKPMALDVADGHALVAAALRVGRRVSVGFTRRFRAPYRALHARLRAEPLPSISDIVFDLAFPASGWRSHAGFLGDDGEGGGVLDDVLSHQIDLLRWLLGDEPHRVLVSAGQSGPGTAEIEFSSGLRVRCTSAHASYVEVLQARLADGRTLVASGTALGQTRGGTVSSRRLRASFRDRTALALGRFSRAPGVTRDSFFHQLRDFAGAIRGEPSAGAGGEDGLAAIATVQACRESLRSGRWCAVG